MNRDHLHQSGIIKTVGSAVEAIVLALCYLVAGPSVASAERLPVKTYTTADGLANNRISRIVRDSRGYLWFCTENGLSRFDGYKFTNYTAEQGLSAGEVNDLLETRSGDYWIATSDGLYRYNPKGLPLPDGREAPQYNPMFVVYRPDGDRMASNIKALYEDRSGVVWVGTWRGLYRLEKAGDQAQLRFIELGMPASDPRIHIVRNILEDRQGALWLTTDSGLYRRFRDGTVDRFTKNHGFSSERLLGLIEDRQGRLWVGDRYGGLCLLVAHPNVNNPVVARRYSTQDGLGCVRIATLYEAPDGRIWIGADCGLAELLPGAGGAGRRISMSMSGEVLADPRVWSFAEDNHGNLWVGTANGAIKVTRGGFTTYTESDGLGSRAVCSMMEIRPGEFCVYTRSAHQAFINRFDGKRFIASKLNLPGQVRPDDCGLCLWDSESRWWIALTGRLMRFPKFLRSDDFGRLRPEGFYPGTIAQSIGDIYSLYEDRRGDLWISTGARRLLRWNRGAAVVHAYPEADDLIPPGTNVYSYAEDKAGNLWFGFGESGVVRYANNRFELFTSADRLPAGAIRSLFVDSKGRLWIGSVEGGLARIDNPTGERPVAVIYTVAEGLSSNKVRSIVDDNWGRLYIGTDQGLDRLDPTTGRIKHFTTADGLANNQVIGGFRDSQGALWFGTHTGLSRLIPEPDHPQSPPPALINRLQISGRPYPISDLGASAISGLELARGQSNIRIEFAGITFRAGEVLRYQHKLEGADQDWSAISEARAVNFANLAPGRYRFLARTVNADGVISEPSASFSFTILSPVWQRWWFLALTATMVGLAGYALHRYRVAQLLKLERMRTRIATDLHDDIGANLTRISILSEVAGQLQNRGDNGSSPIRSALQSIAELARESVGSMSDIIWAINPERDSLIDLTRKMRQHAEEVFTLRDIELKFTAPDAAQDLKCDVNVRRDLYLVFKESVNNAARHSGCSKVEVELRVEGASLTLTVSDNGRGFDPAARTEGNGLLSTRRRAAALGGELILESRAGGGASVRLTVPTARS
ncbi:MAG TPA: two-component regulator propeller domain-containing protein [Blastocatellia bacterium]|nr:two-component regulator propeller domain-containing protein [Blastocatellia bacterium]